MTWLVVAVFASVAAWNEVGRLRAEAVASATAWGEAVEVVVMAESVDAGSTLNGAVRIEPRPRAMVPDGALETVSQTAVATVDLVEGEILIEDRLAGSGRAGLSEGDVIVVIEPAGAHLEVEPGDRVDLWSVGDSAGPPRRVAGQVRVVSSSAAGLRIAIADSEISHVVAAMIRPLVVVQVG